MSILDKCFTDDTSESEDIQQLQKIVEDARSRVTRANEKTAAFWRVNPESKLHDEVSNRDATLKNMGFSSYQDYLMHDLWKFVRDQIRKVDDTWRKIESRCYCCGDGRTVWHHTNYELRVLAGSKLLRSDFYPLCDFCHKIAHRGVMGEWFDLRTVTIRIEALKELHGKGELFIIPALLTLPEGD